MKNNYLHYGKIILLFLVFAISANAQKLPNVQAQSVLAPAAVKIDGKPNEWGTLQAYNHATEVFYTMANDNENLYFVLQATEPDIIDKIVEKGVTLTFQKAGKKTDTGGIHITYPAHAVKNGVSFPLRRGIALDTTPKIADSVMKEFNAKLDSKDKWIRIDGVMGLDTEISVHNEKGIKARGAFNNRRVYTFEMAIALNYLKLQKNDSLKFSYHVTVNGFTGSTSKIIMPNNPTPEEVAFVKKAAVELAARTARMAASESFWNEYTLVLNPIPPRPLPLKMPSVSHLIKSKK